MRIPYVVGSRFIELNAKFFCPIKSERQLRLFSYRPRKICNAMLGIGDKAPLRCAGDAKPLDGLRLNELR
jgi:hypothetical protein